MENRNKEAIEILDKNLLEMYRVLFKISPRTKQQYGLYKSIETLENYRKQLVEAGNELRN